MIALHSNYFGVTIGTLQIEKSDFTAPATFELNMKKNLIGRKSRSSNPDIAIDTSDFTVSRIHCTIGTKVNDGSCIWYIKDETSKNGIYINNKRIEPSIEIPIQNGDVIHLGSLRTVFNLSD